MQTVSRINPVCNGSVTTANGPLSPAVGTVVRCARHARPEDSHASVDVRSRRGPARRARRRGRGGRLLRHQGRVRGHAQGGGHPGQEAGEAGLRPARLRQLRGRPRGSPETTPKRCAGRPGGREGRRVPQRALRLQLPEGRHVPRRRRPEAGRQRGELLLRAGRPGAARRRRAGGRGHHDPRGEVGRGHHPAGR